MGVFVGAIMMGIVYGHHILYGTFQGCLRVGHLLVCVLVVHFDLCSVISNKGHYLGGAHLLVSVQLVQLFFCSVV